MPETIAGRLLERGRINPEGTHCWYKADGRWTPMGYAAAAQFVRQVAGGFVALGLQPGERVSILSNTRREWLHADLGAQAAGGVTVGIYATMQAEQAKYILEHSESRFCVVEDRKQLVKVQEHLGQLPQLKKVIVIDPRDAADGDGRVITLEELRKLGAGKERDVDARLAKIKLDDAALFVYTSGTTGPPKGAVLSHRNVMFTMQALGVVELRAGDCGMSFLPLAHVLQRCVDYNGIYNGTPGYYAESIEKLQANLAEARPTVMAAVPRIFEKIYAAINAQAAAGSPAKQRIFKWALEVGRQVSEHKVNQTEIPPTLRAQYELARRLVFDKLRAKMGGRIRLFITGGAPIAKEILEFFHAADIEVLEGWGMSETCAAGTINLPGNQRFGTIGKPLPGVEMKLDTDGEILIKGGNVMSGYFKDDASSKASFTDEGFFRTGDIAIVDPDGFWKIVDRKKDLIITSGGKKIPPQNLENLLKQHSGISQCMAYGDRQNYIVALVTLDAAWVKERGLDMKSAVRDPEVLGHVQKAIEEVNQHCASYESIKKFRIVPDDFTQETGELTPTLKVKRKVVTEKYRSLIDEMYAEKPEKKSAVASA